MIHIIFYPYFCAMFDKKVFISLSLSILIAFTAIGSVYNIKQTFKSYQSSTKDHVSATKSHQSNDYTTIKSGDFTQSVYSTVKLNIDAYFTVMTSNVSLFKVIFSRATIFYTLHHIQTAIFKMLFPFHTFW